MATGNGTQNLRKAIGAIKDSTMVGMAKVNSEYKKLDVSILKATNHVEVLPKEKHVRTILGSVSGSISRPVVSYCIHGLTRRLAKTRSWPVALKTLIVIHRALRAVDHTFCEELIMYENSGGRMLNMIHFKDDSSQSAWEYSTWIRAYSLYLEECLECYRVLKYDFHRDHSRTKKLDVGALLDQLPALQQLQSRLLDCEPGGAARHNFMILYAFSIIAAESVRLYVAITDGVLLLVDKFFEMQRRQAVRALEIYKRSMKQAERLSEFFEMCRSLKISQKYVKIEQPPTSFLDSMEEYAKDAPDTLMLQWRPDSDNSVKAEAVPEANLEPDPDQACESPKAEKSAEPPPLIPDLLSWEEPSQDASELDEKNPVDLLTATPEDPSNPTSTEPSSEPTGWELALVTTSKSDAAPFQLIKDGGLDRSTLDSLYEMASLTTNLNGANHTAGVSSNPFETTDGNQEMPQAPSRIEQPNYYQMAGLSQEQSAYGHQYMFGYDYTQMAGMQLQQAAFLEQQHLQQDQFMATYMQMAGAYQQQHPQQGQSMAAHDYMQLAGIPQQQAPLDQQNLQQDQSNISHEYDPMQMDRMPEQPALSIEQRQKHEEPVIDHNHMQMVEKPQQMEVSAQQKQNDQPVVGHGSGNPFGDLFLESSTSVPCPPQTLSSGPSLI